MSDQKLRTSVYDMTIRLLMVALIVGWCLLLLYPFANMLIWGVILAIAFAPAHQFLTKRMGGRPKLASVLIVLVFLAILIIPTWIFSQAMIENVREIKGSFDAGTLTLPPPSEKVKSWPIVGEKLFATWSSASVDLRETVVKNKTELLEIGEALGKRILSGAGAAFQLVAAILIAGVLLATRGKGESVHRIFGRLAGDRGDELADVIYKTVGKVVKGVLGVAVIQSFLIGMGFLLSGVPYAGIWALTVFVLAVLQIPTFLVVLPVLIYLFSVNSTLVAVLWTVYLIAAGLSDNILKPLLLGKGAPVPMLVIFVGVIGGFMLSGLIGLFTGAIVMSIGYKLFQSWLNEDHAGKSATKPAADAADKSSPS